MNTSALKRNNLVHIIKAIIKHGPISKPDVAAKTGLTGASIHNLVNELEGHGLVVEDGLSTSSGGRRASLYSFNDSSFYIIGAVVTLAYIHISLFTMGFEALYKTKCKIALAEDSVENVTALLEAEIRKVVDYAGTLKGRLLGVGVTVPGPVDFEHGIVTRITNAPRWNNIPLLERLERDLGVKTVVDKDMNAVILHYLHKKGYSRKNNVIFMSISDGTGAGLFVNGSIYRGNHGLAGEIGHVSVEPDGALCNCGNRGCLELVISNRALYNKLQRMLPDISLPAVSFDREDSAEYLDTLARVMKAKGYPPQIMFEEAALRLALCIGDAIRMYDADQIVIECPWLQRYEDLFREMSDSIFDHNALIDRSGVQISLNDVRDIWVKGAANLVYDWQLSAHEGSLLDFAGED